MPSRRFISVLAALALAGSGLLIAGASNSANAAAPAASPAAQAPQALAPKQKPKKKKKPLKKWTSLSIGEDNSCGITTKQTLWCWGYNSNGELGIGNTKSKYKPVQVKGGGKWLQVSAQDETTCGIKKDGSLWCWGYNAYYAVGDGTDKNRTKPTRVGTAKNWKSISVSFHGCGIKKDNSLWCWGYNNIGQLGTGDYTTAPTPVQVQAGRTWTSVQAGSSSTCALAVNLTDSKKRDLLCWGYGGRGQLGQGTTANSLNPVQVAGNWKSISGANSTVCGVRSDGSGWCWGENTTWQAGAKTPLSVLSPVKVNGTWQRIEVAFSHTCGIKKDKTAWCWGNSWAGALGVGKTSKNGYKLLPTKVKASGKWRLVVVGDHHSCGIKQDKSAWCWGDSWAGKLGNGSKANEKWKPVRVAG